VSLTALALKVRAGLAFLMMSLRVGSYLPQTMGLVILQIILQLALTPPLMLLKQHRLVRKLLKLQLKPCLISLGTNT
tara:strand:+ start:1056 stop:1286 length:231 start_codon:yes stop_codon:yes gene_type:complete